MSDDKITVEDVLKQVVDCERHWLEIAGRRELIHDYATARAETAQEIRRYLELHGVEVPL